MSKEPPPNQNSMPRKSILKIRESEENMAQFVAQARDKTGCPSTATDHHHRNSTHAKFDEENIQETFHPPDKDYGHMKIDEPNTPYQREDQGGTLDMNAVMDRIEKTRDDLPKALQNCSLEDSDHQNGKSFDLNRTAHYKEFSRVQEARELIKKEACDLEDGTDKAGSSSGSGPASASQTRKPSSNSDRKGSLN